MGKLIGVMFVIAVCVSGTGYYNRVQCLSNDGPQLAAHNYLVAVKEDRFEDAYQYVTPNMTDGESVAEWAKLQRNLYQMLRITIDKIDVRAGHRQLKNPFMCANISEVPNVLHASDVLNNQGSSEFEVYTMVMDDGAWKIDSQRTLYDETMIRQWFPEDEIPFFKDTLIK